MSENRIKTMLAISGKSQTEVAREMGIARNTLYSKMSQERFTLHEFLQICEICGAELHAVIDKQVIKLN